MIWRSKFLQTIFVRFETIILRHVSHSLTLLTLTSNILLASAATGTLGFRKTAIENQLKLRVAIGSNVPVNIFSSSSVILDKTWPPDDLDASSSMRYFAPSSGRISGLGSIIM